MNWIQLVQPNRERFALLLSERRQARVKVLRVAILARPGHVHVMKPLLCWLVGWLVGWWLVSVRWGCCYVICVRVRVCDVFWDLRRGGSST